MKIPLGHPGAKNVEIVMRPIGRAIKIGNMQSLPKQETLSAFLTFYKDNPLVSTEVQPTHMLLRDSYRNNLPYHKTSDDKIRETRQIDSDIGKVRKSTYNSSRHTTDMNYKTGDQVLLRNYKMKSKFDPYYIREKFVIMEVLVKGYILLIEIPDHNAIPDNSDNNNDWKKAFEFISTNGHVHYDDSKRSSYSINPNLRRSDRIREPNPRHYNNGFAE